MNANNRFYQNFCNVKEDRKIVDRYLADYMNKEDRIREYFIAITPRSGSSWLTELLYKTRVAGNPEEWFNLDNISGILRKYQCSNIEDYIKCIKADQSTRNCVFGCEASFYQLRLVLEKISFDSLFNSPTCVYWTRKDFLKQGISLFKAVETGYFHSVQGSSQRQEIMYDPDKIKQWILHILYQESHWEVFFMNKKIRPIRLCYEELVSNPSGTIQLLLSHLNILDNREDIVSIDTRHQKISNEETDEILEKFSSDMSDFLSTCRELRGSTELLRAFPQSY